MINRIAIVLTVKRFLHKAFETCLIVILIAMILIGLNNAFLGSEGLWYLIMFFVKYAFDGLLGSAVLSLLVDVFYVRLGFFSSK